MQYFVRLFKKKEVRLDSLCKFRLPRILLTCLMMGAFLIIARIGLNAVFDKWSEQSNFLSAVLLFGLILSALVIFSGSLILTQSISLAEIKRFMRKPASLKGEKQ